MQEESERVYQMSRKQPNPGPPPNAKKPKPPPAPPAKRPDAIGKFAKIIQRGTNLTDEEARKEAHRRIDIMRKILGVLEED